MFQDQLEKLIAASRSTRWIQLTGIGSGPSSAPTGSACSSEPTRRRASSCMPGSMTVTRCAKQVHQAIPTLFSPACRTAAIHPATGLRCSQKPGQRQNASRLLSPIQIQYLKAGRRNTLMTSWKQTYILDLRRSPADTSIESILTATITPPTTAHSPPTSHTPPARQQPLPPPETSPDRPPPGPPACPPR